MRRKFQYIIVILLVAVCTHLHSTGQTVYKTPAGKKYHLESCRMVKNVSEEITLEEVLKLELGPCGICKPHKSYGKTKTTHKAQGTDKVVQCKGMTKAGMRCKHFTRIANCYCFQHQPA